MTPGKYYVRGENLTSRLDPRLTGVVVKCIEFVDTLRDTSCFDCEVPYQTTPVVVWDMYMYESTEEEFVAQQIASLGSGDK